MKKTDIEIATERIGNPLWRINNLYWIVNKRGHKIKFNLNWAQEALYKDVWYCNVILKARQLGISTFICMLFLDRCLFNSNLAAGIICHTREDSELMFKRIKFAYDCLPEPIKALRTATIDSARELVLSNGSSLRVGTSMRGTTLQYLHISEFGKICAKYPEKANEIITGSLNTIAPGQYVFIESTAEGREGHFFDICKNAQAKEKMKQDLSKIDYKFHFFPWWKEPTYRIGSMINMSEEMIEYFLSLQSRGITLENEQKYWYANHAITQKENMLREYPSTPDEAWESAIDGTYYAKYISLARLEKRIAFIPYDETVPVHTAWDLGYNDATTIWFFQIVAKEIHLIDYIEGSGESLTHWLRLVNDREYSYDMHLAPHDVLAHEYTSGISRQVSARKMGVNLTAVTKSDIISGIDAARNILHRCFFDEKKCAKGITALENYKKEWNDRDGCWSSKPLHNQYSHGADAFRTLAVGLSRIMAKRTDDGTTIGPKSLTHPSRRSVF